MNTVFGVPEANQALSLARYASIIGYSDCAFFGVNDPGNANFACRKIWSGYQRRNIADYLVEAQAEVERVIGYPLTGKWVELEEHTYSNPVLLDYTRVLSVGSKVTTTLGDGVAISYASEPATITISGLDITSTDDIHVYYPDTSEEVSPSNITLVAGTLIIRIPKCRAVKYELLDNDEAGIDGSDIANFQTTFDVVQYTTDETDQGELVYIPQGCDNDCTETTYSICVYPYNAKIGSVKLGPIESCSCPSGHLAKVRINYRAGITALTRELETIIVRLAHSRMPEEPCGCDVTQRLWRRDRNVPDILDTERLNCPFGLSDGAWASYRMACSLIDYRMTEFVGKRSKLRSKWV